MLKVKDASKVLSPLFVLYDFRVALAHLQTNEKGEELISFGCERLGLNGVEHDFLIIFDKLIDELNNMYDIMTNYLDKLN